MRWTLDVVQFAKRGKSKPGKPTANGWFLLSPATQRVQITNSVQSEGGMIIAFGDARSAPIKISVGSRGIPMCR